MSLLFKNVKRESPFFMFTRYYVLRGVLSSRFLVFWFHLFCKGKSLFPLGMSTLKSHRIGG